MIFTIQFSQNTCQRRTQPTFHPRPPAPRQDTHLHHLRERPALFQTRPFASPYLRRNLLAPFSAALGCRSPDKDVRQGSEYEIPPRHLPAPAPVPFHRVMSRLLTPSAPRCRCCRAPAEGRTAVGLASRAGSVGSVGPRRTREGVRSCCWRCGHWRPSEHRHRRTP